MAAVLAYQEIHSIQSDFPSLTATLPNRGGFNSEVECKVVLLPTEQFIVKSIGAKRGGFLLPEAVELAKDILIYQKQLESVGIPIPPITDIDVRYNMYSEKAMIYISSPWAGDDVEKIITLLNPIRDGETIDWLVKEMCHMLARVCIDRRANGALTVGIDAKASNFAVARDANGGRIMSYVDQFPPRYWKNNAPIIEWTPLTTELGNELGRFKYFDWRGLLLTLTSQLSRIKPALKEMIETIALNEFAKCIEADEYDEFIGEFSKLPWIEMRYFLQEGNQEGIERIIEECIDTNVFGVRYSVYSLREIALELACRKIIFPDGLEHLFHMTHFEDEEFFSDRWKDVQRYLHECIKNAGTIL